MQQPGRRAGAPDVDLMSNQPGEMTLLVVCSRVECEKRWKMFEGRAEQVVLISPLSTGDARGSKGDKLVTVGVLICCEGCSNSWMYVHDGTSICF